MNPKNYDGIAVTLTDLRRFALVASTNITSSVIATGEELDTVLFSATRRTVGRHESGHAILWTALGYRVDLLSVERVSVSHWTGLTAGESIALYDSPEKFVAEAMMQIAGRVAEEAYGRASRLSSVDEICLARLLCLYCVALLLDQPVSAALDGLADKVFNVVRGATYQLVNRNRRVSNQITDLLVKKRNISGLRLNSILSRVKADSFELTTSGVLAEVKQCLP